MPDPRLFRLRVTFCKQGRLALLSHLEVARALERAVRRARPALRRGQGLLAPHEDRLRRRAARGRWAARARCFDLQLDALRVARARARGAPGGQRPRPHGEVVRVHRA